MSQDKCDVFFLPAGLDNLEVRCRKTVSLSLFWFSSFPLSFSIPFFSLFDFGFRLFLCLLPCLCFLPRCLPAGLDNLRSWVEKTVALSFFFSLSFSLSCSMSCSFSLSLLAPTGALVMMMVYYISGSGSGNFFRFSLRPLICN